MKELPDLTEEMRADVIEWARKLIDAVVTDTPVTWNELMGGAFVSKGETIGVMLVRARIIVDAVSRSRLADALESEVFETSSSHDPLEIAKRQGWNLATTALVRRLREGFTP